MLKWICWRIGTNIKIYSKQCNVMVIFLSCCLLSWSCTCSWQHWATNSFKKIQNMIFQHEHDLLTWILLKQQKWLNIGKYFLYESQLRNNTKRDRKNFNYVTNRNKQAASISTSHSHLSHNSDTDFKVRHDYHYEIEKLKLTVCKICKLFFFCLLLFYLHGVL